MEDVTHLRPQGLLQTPLTEGTGQADIRAFQQGRFARLIEGEEPPHLPMQPLIGKGIGRKLVSQKAANH